MKRLKGLELREFYKKELKEEKIRLKELETKGVKALSKYDIEIAHSGDAKGALWMAKRLVNAHISYYMNLLTEGQQALF